MIRMQNGMLVPDSPVNRMARMAGGAFGVDGGGPTPAGLEPLYIEAVDAGAVFYINSSRNDLDIEYSTDGGQTWTAVTWTAGENDDYVTEVFTLSAVGDKVWLRGDNPQGLLPDPADDHAYFFISEESQKKARLGGCVCSLISKTPESVTALPDDCFLSLFAYNTTIVGKAASFGNVDEIGQSGCDSMYKDTGLTEVADMSKIATIGDYGCISMYQGCTSLTAAADMPLLASIGDGGCSAMYGDCIFNMSDDGTTLNFAFPTPPVTAGETTLATAYDIAQWMGNTNGFN